MKKLLLVSALTLGLCSATLAQGQRERDHKPGMRQGQVHNKHQDRLDKQWRSGRHNDRFEQFNARGPEWRRGKPLPPGFRNRQYIVTDYRAYRLKPPPRGHYWVQVGPDFVLMAIATGIIVDLVLNH